MSLLEATLADPDLLPIYADWVEEQGRESAWFRGENEDWIWFSRFRYKQCKFGQHEDYDNGYGFGCGRGWNGYGVGNGIDGWLPRYDRNCYTLTFYGCGIGYY